VKIEMESSGVVEARCQPAWSRELMRDHWAPEKGA